VRALAGGAHQRRPAAGKEEEGAWGWKAGEEGIMATRGVGGQSDI